MKIVVLDGYALNPGDLSWEGISALGEMTIYDRTNVNDIIERCEGADIVLTNKVPFSSEMLCQLPQLKMIGVMATGYNIIDTKTAKQQGVVVCNIPAYSTASVVQSVFSLLLTITNRVEHYTRQIVNDKRWSKNADFCYWDTPLIELDKKRFGVYGLGNIGSRVAMVAQSFGMDIVALTSKEPSQLPNGITKVDEETFWRECDVVSLHCPLTPATQNLICKDTINKMKQGAIIINTSRGPVVNEQDVADALKEGKLSAFGADVLCTEPAKEDNPLLSAPNVFLTPHIAWATFEARSRLMNILTNNVEAFINGNPINMVN